jgi:hypothetical protein
MAARVYRGFFSEPFVVAEVDHDMSDLSVITTSDVMSPLAVLSVEHVQSGTTDDGDPVYLHHEANVWYTAVPHVVCATAVDCYAPMPFVSAGGTLAFHVTIRNDGNCYLRGCTIQLCLHKTMTDEKDAEGNLLPDEVRLTKVGRFVRSTSIDELPQLWNVIKGDMSLIGPRPLLVQYLPLYSPEQARRHEVRPGITGWAQVNGRNSISWKQKFEYDVWYVDHLSFWLDVKIILLTIKKVFVREGISHEGMATMEPFNGHN